MLDRRGAGRRADRREQRLARNALRTHDPDLEKLVRREGAFDLAGDGRRETGLADENDRLQAVGASFQRLPLGRRKLPGQLSFPRSPRLYPAASA